MPAVLFLRPRPRAFYLLTDTHALVFRQPTADETKASRSVVVAEFLPLDEVDVRGLVRCGLSKAIEGVLGVTSVPTEIFLIVIASAQPQSPLLPASSLRPSRIVSVEFHSLTSATWDLPGLAPHDDDDDDDDPYAPHSASTSSPATQGAVEHPCLGMKKYLESGGFFFAEQCKWDISTRMGDSNWVHAQQGMAPSPLETFDDRFVWNASLLKPFLAFRAKLAPDVRDVLDSQAMLVPVVQGFVGSLPVSTGEWSGGRPEIAALGMLSRLSWKRAGARFRTRGIDDDGQVANFVETEVVLATDTVCMSHVVVRGSVPLFWQQPSQGIQTLQQKVEITRAAFDKHFLELLEHYHAVHAVNLLGHKDAESMLSNAYSDHLRALQRTLESAREEEKDEVGATTEHPVVLTAYDFHAAVKLGGHESVRADFASRLHEIVDSMDRFGWTAIETSTGNVVEQQKGVLRVNCLDCLDRTNYVQDVISSINLQRFLQSINSPLVNSPTLWSAHRELWADNGDRLSKIYAGTGAINTSATRSGKKTFAGLISDASKSLGRAYVNNFQDKGKQTAIDMLLGMMAGQRPVVLFDPVGDSVHAALRERANEYSTPKNVVVWVGTWNLNGKPPSEPLDEWLFPTNTPDADIYSISFQEIVELTAREIVQTDPAKKRMWEKYIMDQFASRKGKSEYILFRSEQLVGTALILVVRSSIVNAMRRVESATRKTGLQGLSGNKGGVGIRFDLYDSTVCFMTCHLAAGHSNVAERNADYHTISKGLKFLRGKTIDDHDIVIWAADFNYRINLPNLDVREFAETDELDPPLAADQLAQAMDNGEVFVGYDEGPIRFRPTYKYDNGSSLYDTSEKARIPAWTGSLLRQKEYTRAELRVSDHRPVYAVFDATVREVDEKRRDVIAEEVAQAIRAKGGRLDEAVDRAADRGVGSLVRDMSSATLAASTRARAAPPRLPDRPNMSRSTSGRVLPASLSGEPLSSNGPSSSRRAPPAPPAPRRPPSAMSSEQQLSRSASGSSLTPMATGDFVLVPNLNAPRQPPPLPSRAGPTSGATRQGPPSPVAAPAPPGRPKPAVPERSPSLPPSTSVPHLPPRPTPQSKGTLDMNGAPPEGLKTPVSPDVKGDPVRGKPPPLPPSKPVELKGKAL